MTSEGQAPKRQRYIWIDTAKTLAIILVVFGHVWRGLNEAALLNPSSFTFLDHAIYLFHMPLFFIISGFLYHGSYTRDWSVLLKRQALFIIWPYILWSIVIVSIKVMLSSSLNGASSLQELGMILYQPISIFWFLYVLFVAQIFVKAFVQSVHSIAALLLIGVAFVACHFYLDLERFVALDLSTKFMIFFIIGFALAKTKLLTRIKDNGIHACLALALFCITQMLFVYFNLTLETVFFPILGTVLSVCVLIVSMWLSRTLQASKAFFIYVSRCTLAIYVSHIICTAGIRIVLMKLEVHSLSIHVISATFLGLVCPIILYEIASKLKISTLMGLGPARKI